MKHSRPLYTVLALLAFGTWGSFASACEDKASASAAAASTKSSTCSASMAAKCTPEMAAACKAKTSAAAVSVSGCPHSAMASGSSACPYHNQGATTKAAKNLDGVTLAAPGGAQSVEAVLVGSGASCNHGAATTSASNAGAGTCSGHGMAKAADSYQHADCDACADMAFCDGEVKSLGATVQIVPLKNGVMYVYTAADPRNVHAVQASMGRRNDRMLSILAAGDKAHLCPSCKSVRGAIASGKLNRELVNIEGGCLTLMTSNDPATLSKIYSMAGLKGPLSVKS
jgi:hypothetical protein